MSKHIHGNPAFQTAFKREIRHGKTLAWEFLQRGEKKGLGYRRDFRRHEIAVLIPPIHTELQRALGFFLIAFLF